MASNTLTKHPSGQFDILFTITSAEMQAAYEVALQDLAKDVELPGFRKGKAPAEKVAEKLDKNQVYDRAIQNIIPQLYGDAVKQHQLRPIITPEVRLVNAKEGEDWQIRATSTELPSTDVGPVLEKLKGRFKSAEIWTPESGKPQVEDAPTDPEAQRNRQLQQIIDFLLKETTMEIPGILVNQETNRLLSNLLSQLEKLGVSLDQYVASTGKTVDALRQDYSTRATEDLKIEFTLAQISSHEHINLTDAELQEFIATAPDQQTRDNLQQPNMINQVRAMLIKRKTLDHLLKHAS